MRQHGPRDDARKNKQHAAHRKQPAGDALVIRSRGDRSISAGICDYRLKAGRIGHD
jgi:hypothetical protein